MARERAYWRVPSRAVYTKYRDVLRRLYLQMGRSGGRAGVGAGRDLDGGLGLCFLDLVRGLRDPLRRLWRWVVGVTPMAAVDVVYDDGRDRFSVYLKTTSRDR